MREDDVYVQGHGRFPQREGDWALKEKREMEERLAEFEAERDKAIAEAVKWEAATQIAWTETQTVEAERDALKAALTELVEWYDAKPGTGGAFDGNRWANARRLLGMEAQA
jgi:hypothetical protein